MIFHVLQTWFKESITYDDDNNSTTPEVTLSGIRSFYTSLGHNSDDYNNNSNFRRMLKNATLWTLGITLNVFEIQEIEKIKISPNPVITYLNVDSNSVVGTVEIKLINLLGKQVLVKKVNASEFNNSYSLNLSDFNNGIYLLNVSTSSTSSTNQNFKIIKL